MICKNCGTTYGENDAFCPGCGVPIEKEVDEATVSVRTAAEVTPSAEETPKEPNPSVDNADDAAVAEGATPSVAETPMPSENVPPAVTPAKKKSKLPIVLIIIAVLVVLAALIGGAIFLVWQLIFKPDSQPVVEENTQVQEAGVEVADEDRLMYAYSHIMDLSESKTNPYAFLLQDNAAEGEMTLEVSELVAAMISPDFTAGSAKLDYQLDYSGGEGLSLLTDITVDNQDIVSFDLYMNFIEQTLALDMPGTVDKAIEMDVAELDPSLVDYCEAIASKDEEQLLALFGDPDMTKALLEEVITVVFDDLEFEASTQSLTADTVTEEMLCMEVVLTERETRDLIVEVFEHLKTSELLKQTVMSSYAMYEDGGYTAEEAYDEVVVSLEESIEWMNESEVSDDSTLTLKTWVDSKLRIRGVQLFTEGEPDDEGELYFAVAKEGDAIGAELSLSAGDQEIIVSGNGTCVDNTLNLPLDVYVNYEHILTAEITDWKTGENGTVKGSVVFSLSKDISEELLGSAAIFGEPTLVLTIDTTKDEAEFSLELVMAGATLVGLYNTTTSEEDVTVYEPAQVTTDTTAWDDVDFNVIIERLEAAGVPATEIIDMLEENFGDSSYDDYYDDYYYDDYYYDDYYDDYYLDDYYFDDYGYDDFYTDDYFDYDYPSFFGDYETFAV